MSTFDYVAAFEIILMSHICYDKKKKKNNNLCSVYFSFSTQTKPQQNLLGLRTVPGVFFLPWLFQ